MDYMLFFSAVLIQSAVWLVKYLLPRRVRLPSILPCQRLLVNLKDAWYYLTTWMPINCCVFYKKNITCSLVYTTVLLLLLCVFSFYA